MTHEVQMTSERSEDKLRLGEAKANDPERSEVFHLKKT
jgi:hypothetical protein